MPSLETSRAIADLIARGALFVINHSGGKDSQAMTILLRQTIPSGQLVVAHAELPGSDWPGLRDHIEATVGGLPVYYCRARKTFLEMVEDRFQKISASGKEASPWPSPKYRQCTSDLKRGPLEKLTRQIAKERGASLIVMCEGLRAEESAERARKPILARHAALSRAGREVWRWLPVHALTEREIFATITSAGQQPHWAYAKGMRRLSCVFCIFATEDDVRRAARLQPDILRNYVNMERRTGRSMLMPRDGRSAFLDDIVGLQTPATKEGV